MPMVLFVCTGNICRSPMAEVLLRARLNRDKARRGWRVKSAGTIMAGGGSASAYAIAEMAERGIDLCAHRARGISRELMEEADLVLAMAQSHVEALEAIFPDYAHDYAHKVHLLSEMTGQKYSVSDPYGGSRLEYAYIAQELEQLIDDGYERIVALVEAAADG
jgi:protein-tyrosine-phosphatase